MISDLMWIGIGIGLVLFFAFLGLSFDMANNCRHKWGKWIYSESEFAYVNQRICEKCGFAETHQHRKMKEGL